MPNKNPNPTGREGKPFSLAPHSFEDALRQILKATPEPKPDKITKKKPAKKTVKKR